MVKTWSFSSLMQYEKCPYSIKLRYIDKAPLPPEDPASPLVRGTLFHENIEQFIKTNKELHSELEPWREKLAEIQFEYHRGMATVEREWGFSTDWTPLPWKEATCRMKLDVGWSIPDHNAFKIIDFKTGKAGGNEIKHTWQGQLYSVGTINRKPELEKVNVEFWYLDFPNHKPLTATYTPSQIEKFQTSFDRRAAKMLNDTEFKPIPNKGNCKYCDYNRPDNKVCPWGYEE